MRKFASVVTLCASTIFALPNAAIAKSVRGANWGGFYASLMGSVSVNFGTLSGEFNSFGTSRVINPESRGNITETKALVPVASAVLALGYNYKFSRSVVIGAETSINVSRTFTPSVKVEGKDDFLFGKPAYMVGGATHVRLGYTVRNIMPYVTVGMAYLYDSALTPDNEESTTDLEPADASADKKTDSAQAQAATEGDSNASFLNRLRFGFSAGAGIDVMISRSLLWRSEYNFATYGWDEEKLNYHYTTNTLKSGFVYKF